MPIRCRLSVLAIALVSIAVAACAPIAFRAGNDFDPAPIGTTLEVAKATKSDVRAKLGAPYSEGRAQMPYQPGARTVWTYFSDRGVLDIGSASASDRRRYLFVFFDGDRLDGYFWFDSSLATAK